MGAYMFEKSLRIFAQNINTNCPIPELLGGAKLLPKSSTVCVGRTNVTVCSKLSLVLTASTHEGWPG